MTSYVYIALLTEPYYSATDYDVVYMYKTMPNIEGTSSQAANIISVVMVLCITVLVFVFMIPNFVFFTRW